MESTYASVYSLMFQAQQSGDTQLADTYRRQMEALRLERNKSHPPVSRPELPPFAAWVVGKDQMELGRSERSNCINAAFNFHSRSPRFEPYTALDFLNQIKERYVQIQPHDKPKWGDLVVAWSRTGGTWDKKRIDVARMNPADADFPYGLVFDHVAVRLNGELVFHKPDATLESRYEVCTFEDAFAFLTAIKGFELTFHRLRS